MTTPNIFSTQYTGANPGDYLNAKVDRSGANRTEYFTVSIPAATTAGTVVGLVPFRRGARFNQGSSQFYVADLDTATTVTLDFGYIYQDNDTTTNVNDTDAFASAVTTAQAGGLITFDEFAGLSWVATADGWIAATTGGTTTTTGSLQGQAVMSYDSKVV